MLSEGKGPVKDSLALESTCGKNLMAFSTCTKNGGIRTTALLDLYYRDVHRSITFKPQINCVSFFITGLSKVLRDLVPYSCPECDIPPLVTLWFDKANTMATISKI
jgi:hypothetical protein